MEVILFSFKVVRSWFCVFLFRELVALSEEEESLDLFRLEGYKVGGIHIGIVDDGVVVFGEHPDFMGGDGDGRDGYRFFVDEVAEVVQVQVIIVIAEGIFNLIPNGEYPQHGERGKCHCRNGHPPNFSPVKGQHQQHNPSDVGEMNPISHWDGRPPDPFKGSYTTD